MITEVACHGPTLNKTEWICAQTKVSGSGSLELALEEMKERRMICTFFAKVKTAGSDISDCFHGCFET